MESSLKQRVFDFCIQNDLSLKVSEIESLDYVILDGEKGIGVMVRDWKRALGFDAVIRAERIKKQNREISDVVILTNSVSPSAEQLAEKIKVPLFRHWEPFEIKVSRRKENDPTASHFSHYF